jgi:hypothetical protein
MRGALESVTERCGCPCGQSLWIDHENLFGMNGTVYTVSFGSPLLLERGLPGPGN